MSGSHISYTSGTGIVGGRQGPSEARRKQQEEQCKRAAEHAEKVKQKEAQKRQKRIEQWESMNGRGPGYFLGGSSDDQILNLQQGDREQVRQQAMEASRWRMQAEQNVYAAQSAVFETLSSPSQDKLTEREEAKRKKKIADWERMNGEVGGNRLGSGGEGQNSRNHVLNESSHRGVLTKSVFQDQSKKPGTARAGSSSSVRTLNTQAAISSCAQQVDEDDLSEEKKREKMRAARLRMQQNMDLKVAEQQKMKEQQNKPEQLAPYTPSKRLAAQFNNLGMP